MPNADFLGLWGACSIIIAVWSITPISYLVVLHEFVLPTFLPEQSAPRTTIQGHFKSFLYHLIIFYSLLEVPFSIYYRYLAIKVQRLRPTNPLSRQDLRQLWLKTLYNGQEQPKDDYGHIKSDSSSSRESFEIILREGRENGLHAITPPPHQLSNPLPNHSSEDYKDYMRFWFNGAPFERIKRDNMLEWVAWSLYNCHYDELLVERVKFEEEGGVAPELGEGDDLGPDVKPDRLGLVENCVELVERRAGMTFPEGRDGRVKSVRLTMDTVRVRSRPLLVYLLVHFFQRFAIKKELGFVEYKEGEISYLLRIPLGWRSSPNPPEHHRPLLFLHGLGVGTLQYSQLITHLATDPALRQRPIVVLLQPHISMSFFSKSFLSPPDSKECVEGLKQMARTWGFHQTGFTILSHSNGSVAHGWLLRAAPELCVRSCFVDPIPFCIWEPWVCWNFLYAAPKTPFEILMRYFIARELGVAVTLQRSFSWTDNLLLASQIPNLTSTFHTSFHLAENDCVINTSRIRKHLLDHGVPELGKNVPKATTEGGLKLHLDTQHGQSMTVGREQIIRWLAGECSQESEMEN